MLSSAIWSERCSSGMRISFFADQWPSSPIASEIIEVLTGLGEVEHCISHEPGRAVSKTDLCVVWDSPTWLGALYSEHGAKLIYVLASPAHHLDLSLLAHAAAVITYSSVAFARAQGRNANSILLRYFPDPDCSADLPCIEAPLSSNAPAVPRVQSRRSVTGAGAEQPLDRFLASIGTINSSIFCRTSLPDSDFSFLPAMARGAIVCVPETAATRDYVIDTYNGFFVEALASPGTSLEHVHRMGCHARRSIEAGHKLWMNDKAALARLAESVAGRGPSSQGARGVPESQQTHHRQVKDDSLPRATVATVCLNAKDQVLKTVRSVASQDYGNLEFIVVDGGSRDGTIEALRTLSDRIDAFISEPDRGVYDAMNKAAQRATGEWIIFINAGDEFLSESSLSALMHSIPSDADFVVSHHIYVATEGPARVHRVRDFGRSWAMLKRGEVGEQWLAELPGHQSTLTRTRLLQKHGYALDYRIAADYEFLFRMFSEGHARFHAVPVIGTRYYGGGLSWQNRLKCVAEWWAIAARHTANRRRVDDFFTELATRTAQGCEDSKVWGAVPVFWRLKRSSAIGVAKLALRRMARRRIQFGTTINLKDPQFSSNCTRWGGISACEGWGSWTVGNEAWFELRNPVRGTVHIVIDIAQVFEPATRGTFVVCFAGHSEERRASAATRRMRFTFFARSAESTIKIRITNPVSPNDEGMSDDTRLLGLGLSSIRIFDERTPLPLRLSHRVMMAIS